MSTQTQILAERAVALKFTDPLAYVDVRTREGSHLDDPLRRVPTRGQGPLVLTLIPVVAHLDDVPIAAPLDGPWQSLGDCWVRASSKCHPAKTARGEQTCLVRCVQLMELVVTITHTDSGLGISARHPYADGRSNSWRTIRPLATLEGVAMSERVLGQLLAVDIDWSADRDMLPLEDAARVVSAAWWPELDALLRSERKSADAWREQLGALSWPERERDEKIFEAECDRFFWRRSKR